MSFWLFTLFDGGARDEEIIKYWVDMRNPRSTAVAITLPPSPVTNESEVNPVHEAAAHAPASRQDAARWLYDNHHPHNLARKVKSFICPYLSPKAKAREGGIRIRASFCLGNEVQDIFDFDIGVGTNADGEDVLLDHLGPREDSWDEDGRSEEKLANRRWF